MPVINDLDFSFTIMTHLRYIITFIATYTYDFTNFDFLSLSLSSVTLLKEKFVRLSQHGEGRREDEEELSWELFNHLDVVKETELSKMTFITIPNFCSNKKTMFEDNGTEQSKE